MITEISKRQKWLEDRRTGLGATDVAVIVGAVVPGAKIFRSPVDVWLDKMGMLDTKDNEAMYWGRMLEPVVAKRYSRDTNFKLEKSASIVRHPTVPHFVCSPDRLIGNSDPPRGLEIKTAGRWGGGEWGPSESDEVPIPYLIQVQWCMFVTGRPKWDLAALLTGNDYRIYRFQYDTELCAVLAEKAEKFWNDHILTEEPPAPDKPEIEERLLKYLHPVSDGKTRSATIDEMDIAYRYAGALAGENEAKERKKAAQIELLKAIGDLDGIVGPDGEKITWKNQRDKQIVDWKAALIEAGGTQDLIEKHTKNKPETRVFRCGAKLEN